MQPLTRVTGTRLVKLFAWLFTQNVRQAFCIRRCRVSRSGDRAGAMAGGTSSMAIASVMEKVKGGSKGVFGVFVEEEDGIRHSP